MFIRLFLIVILIPLQSCSNTLVGQKLENSFDNIDSPLISEKLTKTKGQNKLKEIKLGKKNEKKKKEIDKGNNTKEKSISNKERLSQKSNKAIKKTIFNPQPYRIILKLSGANPSAPAETVTNALRKAGVQFEVEKIERFEDKSLLKDSSLKRKEF
tara:strand:- start:147 stop:614 length:468 start_codon:yes stop_codon:yes gene_type:complete